MMDQGSAARALPGNAIAARQGDLLPETLPAASEACIPKSDLGWCVLVMRPDDRGGSGVGTGNALGRWLGRQFKVSSVHFVSAEDAGLVIETLHNATSRHHIGKAP